MDLKYKLKKGEQVCDKCEGIGYIPRKNIFSKAEICEKCQGDGYIDWISNVTGKPAPCYDSTSMPYISQVQIIKRSCKDIVISFLSKNKKLDSLWEDSLENDEEYLINKIDKKVLERLLE